MVQRYKLVCECGEEHPVEISQAGRTITCTCGKKLPIPSMLKMKRLPGWETEGAASSAPESEPAPVAEPASAPVSAPVPRRRSRVPAKRKGLLIAGVIGVILFSVLLIRALCNPPKPINVLQIQRYYMDNGKVIARDSNPIAETDAYFFITRDNLIITDGTIDRFTPFYAMEYFDYLKTGLDLSDNFYDKYDSLYAGWKLTIALDGFLVLLSLAAGIFSFFIRGGKTVGIQRGSAWKS